MKSSRNERCDASSSGPRRSIRPARSSAAAASTRCISVTTWWASGNVSSPASGRSASATPSTVVASATSRSARDPEELAPRARSRGGARRSGRRRCCGSPECRSRAGRAPRPRDRREAGRRHRLDSRGAGRGRLRRATPPPGPSRRSARRRTRSRRRRTTAVERVPRPSHPDSSAAASAVAQISAAELDRPAPIGTSLSTATSRPGHVGTGAAQRPHGPGDVASPGDDGIPFERREPGRTTTGSPARTGRRAHRRSDGARRSTCDAAGPSAGSARRCSRRARR